VHNYSLQELISNKNYMKIRREFWRQFLMTKVFNILSIIKEWTYLEFQKYTFVIFYSHSQFVPLLFNIINIINMEVWLYSSVAILGLRFLRLREHIKSNIIYKLNIMH
jgi:hypothetical protein